VATGGGCFLVVGRARDLEAAADMMFHRSGARKRIVSILNVITTYDLRLTTLITFSVRLKLDGARR